MTGGIGTATAAWASNRARRARPSSNNAASDALSASHFSQSFLCTIAAIISVSGFSCAAALAFTRAFLIASTSAPLVPLQCVQSLLQLGRLQPSFRRCDVWTSGENRAEGCDTALARCSAAWSSARALVSSAPNAARAAWILRTFVSTLGEFLHRPRRTTLG